MITEEYSKLVLCFTLYSVFGWCCETVWCSIGARKLVKRGFLYGPYCPIYGYGAMIILAIVRPLEQNPILVFLASMLAATLLEYFTGWLLETLFQTRWWDYSSRKFQLKGRICLRNSLLFGLLGTLVTYFIHPHVRSYVLQIKPETLRVASSLLLAVLVLDSAATLAGIGKLQERLADFKMALAEMERYNTQLGWYDPKDLNGSVERLRQICQNDKENETAILLLQKIEELTAKNQGGARLVKTFPTMKPKGFSTELTILQNKWEAQKTLRRKTFDENKITLKAKVYTWTQQVKTAYRDISFSQMVWIFLIACVLGYVVETLYCILLTGHVESRQGMLYGPFNQVYGFGAVVLVLLLAPFANKKAGWLFCASAVAGGLFEVVCSLVQEYFFGTLSWQYTGQPFALFGGRTSLLYMFFWGVLGCWFIKKTYPKITSSIQKIEVKSKRIITCTIVIGLSINMILSALAVNRWSQRQLDVAPSNAVDTFLDKQYPDDMMKDIYPNMWVLENTDKKMELEE